METTTLQPIDVEVDAAERHRVVMLRVFLVLMVVLTLVALAVTW
jgi:hypothetical protein